MTDKIDLHMHSARSDGTLTPKELAAACAEAGLRAAAITDHDSMEGAEEFVSECEALGIEGIAGVEISAKYKHELHIVGLYVGGADMSAKLERIREGRKLRNIEMVKKLREGGFYITMADACSFSTDSTPDTIGRVHIAKALVEKGYAASVDEVFSTMIGRGMPYYVKRFSLTPEASISLIKNCGGAAVWAHPVYTEDTEEALEAMAKRLKDAGLDAMECLYSRYSDAQTDMCMRIAKRTGLLISGGSDFHGEDKPDVKIGTVNGGCVPYGLLEKIKERIR